MIDTIVALNVWSDFVEDIVELVDVIVDLSEDVDTEVIIGEEVEANVFIVDLMVDVAIVELNVLSEIAEAIGELEDLIVDCSEDVDAKLIIGEDVEAVAIVKLEDFMVNLTVDVTVVELNVWPVFVEDIVDLVYVIVDLSEDVDKEVTIVELHVWSVIVEAIGELEDVIVDLSVDVEIIVVWVMPDIEPKEVSVNVDTDVFFFVEVVTVVIVVIYVDEITRNV